MSILQPVKKNCGLPNHEDQEHVVLSNSEKLPSSTTAACESKDASEEFPDAAIVVSPREVR